MSLKILSRLSIRTILVFKSVSKHWYRVISSPQLAKLQLIWSTEHPKYILFSHDCCGGTIAYLINGGGEIDQVIILRCFEGICSPMMICSFNGLICCINVPSDLFEMEIRVCNPATREVLLLPKACRSKMHPQFGVFFGPEENEYKVFCFFCDASKPEDEYYYLKCEIYYSETGSWKGIGRVPFCPMVNIYCPLSPDHVFVGGKLYWFLRVEEETDIIPGSILSVDEDENFTIIGLPDEITVWSLLIDLEGSLGLVTVDESMVDIWVLTNHEKSSWSLRACTEFCVGEIDAVDSVAARKNEIFFIVKDAFRILHFLVYNLANETWRELDFADSFEDLSPAVFPFTESLLPCSRPQEQ